MKRDVRRLVVVAILTFVSVGTAQIGPANPALAASWVHPVEGGSLGQRWAGSDPSVHNGVDIGAQKGVEIRAVHGGVVEQVVCDATLYGEDYSCDVDGSPSVMGCGWYVGIFHSDDGTGTLYCHMSSRPLVNVGDNVSTGEVIGYVGSSGNSSEPHLHFETHDGSSANNYNTVDPVPFMADRGVDLAGGGSDPPPPSDEFWVDTFANAPGAKVPGGIQTGWLYAGRNYVYCKQWGPIVEVNGAYNHWWLKTDLDTGNPWQNQWVSAYYLSRWGDDEARDNDGTEIPTCKHWVDTFAAAPGFSTPGQNWTGTLNKGTNYVYCKRLGPRIQEGSAYNDWWLKTDLDYGNPWQNQWVSAYYLSRWGNNEAKDNDGNDIPICW